MHSTFAFITLIRNRKKYFSIQVLTFYKDQQKIGRRNPADPSEIASYTNLLHIKENLSDKKFNLSK